METSTSAQRSVLSWVAAGALLIVLVVVYPLLASQLGDRVGTRGLASALVILNLLALLLPRLEGLAPSRGARAVLLMPLVAAAITEDARFLRAAPALIHLWVAWLFAGSLRTESSLIEWGARVMEPQAPPFIRPYCRKVTALWAGVEAVHAVAILYLALFAPVAAWSRFAGVGVWVTMGALGIGEYFVRKAWFRYYLAESPIDRAWARILPPENTAVGRRSVAYSRKLREQGFKPRGLRALFKPGAFASVESMPGR